MCMLNCYVLDWKWGECVGVFTDHYWTSQAVQTPDEWRGKTLSLWSLQITNQKKKYLSKLWMPLATVKKEIWMYLNIKNN